MNRYLRAIGFLDNFNREKYERIVEDIMFSPDNIVNTHILSDKSVIVDKIFETGDKKGICVRVIKDKKGNMYRESVFPYYKTENYEFHEDVSFEKKITGEEFLGVYEDLKLGENIFFTVLNAGEVYRIKSSNTNVCSISISALSIAGNVILPIKKNEQEKEDVINFNNNRVNLLNKANDGDQNAFATIRRDDILTNVTVSEQIFVQEMDIYTVVDSSFIPCGAECDLYSILGEIVGVSKEKNRISDESIYNLDILVKGVILKVCINEADLLGEPQVGFRFKGTVWLQGNII